MLSQNEQREDKLRKEIIEQGKKMNELRSDHERQMYETTSTNNSKVDQMQQRMDADKKKAQQKLKDEIGIKNEKIKEMERQMQKDKALREKAESSIRQMEELKEMQKNL